MTALGHSRSARSLKVLRCGIVGRIQTVKRRRLSCMTIYGLFVMSGEPAIAEPGVCPICESRHCNLARALQRRSEIRR